MPFMNWLRIKSIHLCKRDIRFADRDRFKDGINHRKPKRPVHNRNIFTNDDFSWDHKRQCFVCKNRKMLKRKARAQRIRNIIYDMYRAKSDGCFVCPLRLKYLPMPETQARYLLVPLEHAKEESINLIEKMKAKIDTLKGRRIYSKRLVIVEPVFANIRTQKRLDRFTLRTRVKVDIQWKLFALVHNIEKIAGYGMVY
ncbi:MAG: hypothetical protein GF353_03675 [Candidatus Lokiarchaeota archaeon]|nr:hypothetical protein [Candidatus Lokiarchaeota archaeon]